MKILKWIGGILALLIVGFFMIGVFVPTFTYVSAVEVEKPVDEAFAVFTDVERMEDWMPGFKSIETLSGGPNEVGSQYRLVFEEQGETMEMTETVTAFEQNELFAFKLVSDVMFVETEIRFQEVNGTTEITSTNEVEGRNIFWKSLLPFFKSEIEDRSQQTYENLKQVIETTDVSMEGAEKADEMMSSKNGSN